MTVAWTVPIRGRCRHSPHAGAVERTRLPARRMLDRRHRVGGVRRRGRRESRPHRARRGWSPTCVSRGRRARGSGRGRTRRTRRLRGRRRGGPAAQLVGDRGRVPRHVSPGRRRGSRPADSPRPRDGIHPSSDGGARRGHSRAAPRLRSSRPGRGAAVRSPGARHRDRRARHGAAGHACLRDAAGPHRRVPAPRATSRS
jgi:hypothetical protein